MRVFLAFLALIYSCKGHSQTAFTVYFDFNKYGLTTDAIRQLDSFLLAKKESAANYSIHLNGYCDPAGTDEYNKTLSLNRVSTVKTYLLNNGIHQSDIVSASGHGENDPLNKNKTEEERQLNRRVEITLGKGDQASLSSSKENLSLTQKIADTATVAGTSIVLKNMNFYGGTPFLLPESSLIVDELIEVMQRHPKLVIEIQGHICCIASAGDAPYGGAGSGLSEERARAIYAELIGHGIEATRVSYKGFGHSMPIYPFPEKTEEERIVNRRVEIKIISK